MSLGQKINNPFFNLKGRRVLVTGASGYIGSELVKSLVKYSCDVTCISHSQNIFEGVCEVIEADINNFNVWTDAIKGVEIIYHLAANTSIYDAANAPFADLSSTMLPLHNCIKAAEQQCSKPRFIFSSTASVYGLHTAESISEEVIPAPLTFYDLHKFFAEQQIGLADRCGIINGISLRLANVYGPSERKSTRMDRGVINMITKKALLGENIVISGSGDCLRDYVYISDVVEAFLWAGILPQSKSGVFNIGTGRGTSLRDAFGVVAKQVEIITGNPVKISHAQDLIGSIIDSRSYAVDSKKFMSITQWAPKVLLEDGIQMMARNFFNQDDCQ